MFKKSPKKYFEKLLSCHLNKITQHKFEYKLHILLENTYDFETNICVEVNKKFREIFELQSESSIESIYGELEAVMADDPFIEDMRFLSNITYFKLAEEFWDDVDSDSSIEDVVVVDLIGVESEIDFEVKEIIFGFVKERESSVSVHDFPRVFETVKEMERGVLEKMFFDVKKRKDRKFGRDEEELGVGLVEKRAEILNEILGRKVKDDSRIWIICGSKDEMLVDMIKNLNQRVGSTTLEIPKISYNGGIVQDLGELGKMGLSKEHLKSARNSFLIQNFKTDKIMTLKTLVEEIRIENEIAKVRNSLDEIYSVGDLPSLRSLDYKYEDCFREQFFNNKINKKIRTNRQKYYKELLNLTKAEGQG